MKYMGSKSRIAQELLTVMLPYRTNWWVEPFVGGGNMIDKVKGNRLGADINADAINALIRIRDAVDTLPKNNKEFTEQDYRTRNDPFGNFAYSWGGRWRGGWARGLGRDYVEEAYKNAIKQSPKLQGVILKVSDYIYLDIPPNSLIYCDPPYQNANQYKDTFDSGMFWLWCRKMSKLGHTVFVSEYDAPSDFKCVWSKVLNNELGSNVGIEKLFIK